MKNIIKLIDEQERKACELTQKDKMQEMAERLQALVQEAVAAVTT